MFHVYVLRSVKTGKRYIGQTGNLTKRIASHNENESRYTKGRGPWEIIYTEQHETRAAAMRRERFLKSGKGREFLDSVKQ